MATTGSPFISVADYTVDQLYSSLIVDADGYVMSNYTLFGYGQSQPVPGAKETRLATKAFTNVPRPGDSGLPMGWEMYVCRWRATTNLRIDEPIMDWAAESFVQLFYNGHPYSTLPLLDLLMAPQAFMVMEDSADEPNNLLPGISRGVLPLWMRENITYEVRIQTPHETTGLSTKLLEYLLEHTRGHRMILWVYLEGVLRRNVR